MNPEITIHLTGFDNDAVVGREEETLANILREIADRIENDLDDQGVQFDDNGNPIAHWSAYVTEED